jgi:hypothetical protein
MFLQRAMHIPLIYKSKKYNKARHFSSVNSSHYFNSCLCGGTSLQIFGILVFGYKFFKISVCFLWVIKIRVSVVWLPNCQHSYFLDTTFLLLITIRVFLVQLPCKLLTFHIIFAELPCKLSKLGFSRYNFPATCQHSRFSCATSL